MKPSCAKSFQSGFRGNTPLKPGGEFGNWRGRQHKKISSAEVQFHLPSGRERRLNRRRTPAEPWARNIMDQKHNPLRLLVVLGGLVAIVSAGWGQSSKRVAGRSDSPTAVQPVVNEPAGATRCQFCHPSQVEGYARSAMAHSLRRAGQEPDGTVNTPDAKITMHSSPVGYWQRLQSGGDAINYRIDYVIGSGNHASGYLLDLEGHLFQSPVAYYKSRGAYDLAPGYEGLPNPDFTRPVAEGCLFCHSGTAVHISGTSNAYRSPAFSAEAITCERCHGSAAKHLGDPRAGTIINPAKLDHAARQRLRTVPPVGGGQGTQSGEKVYRFSSGTEHGRCFHHIPKCFATGRGRREIQSYQPRGATLEKHLRA